MGEIANLQHKPSWINRHSLSTIGPNPTLHLFFIQEKTGSCVPKTGLSPLSNYNAYYLPSHVSRPITLELTLSPTVSNKCAFWEVDSHIMPGIYGLQVPLCLRACDYTFVYLHFAGAHPLYLELYGVEYDPYDSFALGLKSWIRSTCHEHLSSGLRKSMPAAIWPLLDDWFKQEGKEIATWKSL